MDGYGGDATCNYVTLSNVPKHWGSIYWTCLFQVSIRESGSHPRSFPANLSIAVLWIWVSVAGDAVVFFSGEKNGARSGLAAGRFTGLYPGSHAYQPNQRYTPFFCAANGFLKLFIGVTYLSQSFGGLADGGGHFDRFGQWVGGGPDAQQFCFAAGVTMLLSALPVAFCALVSPATQLSGGLSSRAEQDLHLRSTSSCNVLEAFPSRRRRVCAPCV